MEIADAAREVGVTPAALRHYEAFGLLDERHVVRRPSGYRTYPPEGLERLRLIAAGRAVGLSLKDIRARIEAWEDGSMTEADRVAFFRAHLLSVEAKIAHLTAIRDYVEAKTTGPPP